MNSKNRQGVLDSVGQEVISNWGCHCENMPRLIKLGYLANSNKIHSGDDMVDL